jgi:hypothetical protein
MQPHISDATNFPSLAGSARAQAEDQAWATAMFGWATGKLRRIEAAVAKRPLSERLWCARDDTAAAITEQLTDWEPPHRAN